MLDIWGRGSSPFTFAPVIAKFGLCSKCSQKLDGCSLASARKIFATVRMLAFSLTIARNFVNPPL